ncbi:MAG: hypothetical protein ACREDR_06420 [Blastocatellia bacterium]
MQFRLAADVVAELEVRSGRRGRGRTLETCIRRYAALIRSARKSLVGRFTEDELRFLVEIYPGLLLDREGALPLWEQVAQALECAGVARPGLVKKLKIDLLRTAALLDAVEQGMAEVRSKRTSRDVFGRVASAALRILNRAS